jgi:hypothetical protein
MLNQLAWITQEVKAMEADNHIKEAAITMEALIIMEEELTHMEVELTHMEDLADQT